MPLVSLAVVSLISLIFICVGDVNFLAPIVTMPFLITYTAVDYAYFALAVTADSKHAATNSPSSKSLNVDTRLSEPDTGADYGSINKEKPSPLSAPEEQTSSPEPQLVILL